MADPILWNVEPEDLDKTIDPGIHLSRVCECGNCERHDPPDTYGYLRFLPKGKTTGATIFVSDQATYEVIEQTLMSMEAEPKSGSLALLAPAM